MRFAQLHRRPKTLGNYFAIQLSASRRRKYPNMFNSAKNQKVATQEEAFYGIAFYCFLLAFFLACSIFS